MTARDTLIDPPPDSVRLITIVKTVPGGSSTNSVELPFGARFLRALGNNGEVAEAISSVYSVAWFDGTGKRLHTLTRRTDPPWVSPNEKKAAEESIAEFVKKMGASPATGTTTIPAIKAPIVAVGFDLDGRLWIERSVAEGKPREADVYVRQGQWVSTMIWPAAVELRFMVTRGNTAVGVATDSLGVPTVVRLRFK